ncbi:MAG: AarF/ABC1/UbiB kinase family protein [Anaerolineae bacterium]|nr:AarF/ABC1/UbiB kinase family protein [Anaerolineae bacterium]
MKRRSRLDEFRESLRLQQSYNTIMRYGLDFALDRGLIGLTRRFFLEWLYGVDQSPEVLTVPVKTRLLLQELGPIYVKVGQLISSQSQALPPDWAVELSKLQSNVRPFPYEQVRDIIMAELGAPPEEIYATFDTNPLAAASLGQVHRATLYTGEEVVVKVQRPNIIKQVRADVGIMSWLARLVQRRLQWAQDMGLVGVVDEFGQQVLAELDYRIEAYNIIRLNQNLEGIPAARLPAIYNELCTGRVLTMEFIDGIKITNLTAIDAAGFDKEELAKNALRATLKQILIDGFFHGDLHPGNVFVNRRDGHIIFLDVGMVGELTVRQRANMINMLMMMQQADVRGLAQAARSLSMPFREVNEHAFQRDFERRVGRLMQQQTVPMSETLNEVMSVLRENGLQLDPSLTLAIKSMMQMEAAGRRLFPTGGFVEVGIGITLELVRNEITAENITNVVKQEASYTLREVAQRLPSLQEATLKWLDQYQKGRLEIYHDTSGLNEQVDSLGRLVRYVILGILLGGMIVGSAIATGIAAAFEFEHSSTFTTIAFVGYVVATVLAALLVIVILWQLWHGRDKP